MKNVNNIFIIIAVLFSFQSCLSKKENNQEKEYKQRIITFKDSYIKGDTLYKYYKNGNIKLMRIKDTVQNKMLIYDYYEDGKIKSYAITRNMNDVFFLREYDRYYKAIKDSGNIMGEIIENDTVFTGDTLELNIMLARPPNCIYFLTAKIDGYEDYNLELKKNIAQLKLLSNPKGSYDVKFFSSIKDTLIDTAVFSEQVLKMKFPCIPVQ